jgi:hypothetical protein
MNKSSAITAIKICQLLVITRFYFLSQKDGITEQSQTNKLSYCVIRLESTSSPILTVLPGRAARYGVLKIFFVPAFFNISLVRSYPLQSFCFSLLSNIFRSIDNQSWKCNVDHCAASSIHPAVSA